MLVTIAAYAYLADACLSRVLLEGAGIPCFLENESLIGIHALYSGALGGVRLQVPEESAEAALLLLAEAFGPFSEEGGDPPSSDLPPLV